MKIKQGKPAQPPPPQPPLSEKISSKLRKIFEKMPSNSFLDKTNTLLIILCAAGYLLFVVGIYFLSPPISLLQSQLEPSLTPELPLQIQAGESYIYMLSTSQNSVVVQYDVRTAAGCNGLQVEDNSGSSVCISSQGRLVGEDMPSNFRLGNHTIILFEPWMLSVSNDSNWTIENRISAGGAQFSVFSFVRCTGEETVGGRKAFRVETGIEGAEPVKIYVDEEKRVLLLGEAGNVTILLVRAPFALNWTTQN